MRPLAGLLALCCLSCTPDPLLRLRVESSAYVVQAGMGLTITCHVPPALNRGTIILGIGGVRISEQPATPPRSTYTLPIRHVWCDAENVSCFAGGWEADAHIVVGGCSP